MRPVSLGLVLVSTFLTSAAQLFYKLAVPRLPEVFTNWPLIAGLVCYGLSAGLFVMALRKEDVGVLYPVFATSYIWVGFGAWWLFSESLTALKVFGMLIVVLGVGLIGYGSRGAASVGQNVQDEVLDG